MTKEMDKVSDLGLMVIGMMEIGLVDIKEGKGKYFWTNGDRYVGDFRNNKKDGKGIFYWVNGFRYEGYWRNDK